LGCKIMDKRYVLMSLREKPYRKILSGEKKYEYRTRYTNQETVAFIYVSQSVKKVCGIIFFDKPIVGNTEEMSRFSEKHNPGSYSVMKEYFKKGTGYAIPVKKVIEFSPISLSKIKEHFPNFVVPQSYYYLDTQEKKELLEFLLREANLQSMDSLL